MKNKVHCLEIKMESGQSKIEQFLNDLEKEIVSIIPIFKIDHLVI